MRVLLDQWLDAKQRRRDLRDPFPRDLSRKHRTDKLHAFFDKAHKAMSTPRPRCARSCIGRPTPP